MLVKEATDISLPSTKRHCLLHNNDQCTVYPKKYAHGFVVLCFVVVMQSFILNLYEVFIHIHQGCFAGTGAIVRLPQCQWSKPDGCGKISQCITTTKHSKAKTVCIFLGIYCRTVLTGNPKMTGGSSSQMASNAERFPSMGGPFLGGKWPWTNWLNEVSVALIFVWASHVMRKQQKSAKDLNHGWRIQK